MIAPAGPVTVEAPSFAEVSRAHLAWLYSLARRLAGDAADDLVQDCLLKAFRSYDDLRDPEAVGGWLRQILVNCVRDHFRHEARGVAEEPFEDADEVEGYSLYRRLVDEDPLPYSDTLHLDFLSSFAIEDVWEVLARLSPLYRVPLVLVHMEGYATKEVAELLDAPLGTILSRLHRGRRLFERELWRYAEENDLLRRTGRERRSADDQL